MTEKQPEALRLAAWLDGSLGNKWPSYVPQEAATELRRQRARIAELGANLKRATSAMSFIPLTDAQIDQIHSDNCVAYESGDVEYESRGLARAIEAAHGITATEGAQQ